MTNQTLTYKDTEVYKNTLTMVRMILILLVTESAINKYKTIVFLCDNNKSRKYLREIIDETLRSIPTWLGCSVDYSGLRRIDFKNRSRLIFEINPNDLKGLTYSNVFYLGSENKFEEFKNILNNYNKNFTIAVIKED